MLSVKLITVKYNFSLDTDFREEPTGFRAHKKCFRQSIAHATEIFAMW